MAKRKCSQGFVEKEVEEILQLSEQNLVVIIENKIYNYSINECLEIIRKYSSTDTSVARRVRNLARSTLLEIVKSNKEEGYKMTKMTLNIADETNTLLEKMKSKMHKSSKGEVLQTAISVLKALQEAKDKKLDILMDIDNDGRKEKLKVLPK